MVIVDVTDQNDFFQWLFYMDSKAKILRTEELQFVTYVNWNASFTWSQLG